MGRGNRQSFCPMRRHSRYVFLEFCSAKSWKFAHLSSNILPLFTAGLSRVHCQSNPSSILNAGHGPSRSKRSQRKGRRRCDEAWMRASYGTYASGRLYRTRYLPLDCKGLDGKLSRRTRILYSRLPSRKGRCRRSWKENWKGLLPLGWR